MKSEESTTHFHGMVFSSRVHEPGVKNTSLNVMSAASPSLLLAVSLVLLVIVQML